MRALGADVQLADDVDAAHAAAEAFATQHRALLVTDGRDPVIGEGAGTIGVELLRWPDPFDAILAPVGEKEPYPEALADLTGLVDDMLLVDDATMLEAMRLSLHELGLVLEPSGAASLAAILTHRARFEGQLVGAILTGGYVTAEQMQQWLAPSGPI